MLTNTLVVCPSCERINRVPLERAQAARPICGSCKSELPLHEGVQDVSGTALGKLFRSSDRAVIVDFWAQWCGPCKAFAPTFKGAAKEMGSELIFAKLDTEAFPLAAQTYKIQGIPTLIVFKDGVEVDRRSGAMPLPMLLDYVAQWK